MVIQIVDCRNPFFYRCQDIEEYVTDLGKKNFLILNKADLIPEEVRILLSEELKSLNVDHIFFSAKHEQKIIDEGIESESKCEEIKFNTANLINKYQLFNIFEQFTKKYGNKNK